MIHIYAVWKDEGSYDDYHEWVDAIYADRESAEKHADLIHGWVREHDVWESFDPNRFHKKNRLKSEYRENSR